MSFSLSSQSQFIVAAAAVVAAAVVRSNYPSLSCGTTRPNMISPKCKPF